MKGEYVVTDILIVLLVVGACAIFLGIRAFRSFQGKGSCCGCACSGGCAPEASPCDNQRHIQTDITQVTQEEEKS